MYENEGMNVESLNKKYSALHRVRDPTGDPNFPSLVK